MRKRMLPFYVIQIQYELNHLSTAAHSRFLPFLLFRCAATANGRIAKPTPTQPLSYVQDAANL